MPEYHQIYILQHPLPLIDLLQIVTHIEVSTETKKKHKLSSYYPWEPWVQDTDTRTPRKAHLLQARLAVITNSCEVLYRYVNKRPRVGIFEATVHRRCPFCSTSTDHETSSAFSVKLSLHRTIGKNDTTASCAVSTVISYLRRSNDIFEGGKRKTFYRHWSLDNQGRLERCCQRLII